MPGNWRSPRALGHGIGAALSKSAMWEDGVQDVVLLLLLHLRWIGVGGREKSETGSLERRD